MGVGEVVSAWWAALDSRDWGAAGALLADDVVYEVPQTGERVRGRDANVRFNAEYPGDWRIEVTTLVAGDRAAATTIRFSLPDEADQTGVTFFTLDDEGRIATITDWWPEPYEAPPGREHLVERTT